MKVPKRVIKPITNKNKEWKEGFTGIKTFLHNLDYRHKVLKGVKRFLFMNEKEIKAIFKNKLLWVNSYKTFISVRIPE